MKKSPFHMLFGVGLKRIFCDHKGKHEEWGYRFGSGIAELYCGKCGKVIKRVALDDMPKETLQRLLELLKQDDEGPRREPDEE